MTKLTITMSKLTIEPMYQLQEELVHIVFERVSGLRKILRENIWRL
ncbi:MAG: hypothetical protein MjAS7_0826 [Metallosphaera javensis (ex Sakai et al. 2022)]|nr:MAG: hypothetical protein MjAS7_0826 [Metallosphaera javensis (ex Sakai et al. 2022)]